MVLFALETIYLLCTKQMVYMCKAKACTASGAHSNDEDAPVLPVAPGDVQQGVQYPARATKNIHANIHVWDGQFRTINPYIGFISVPLRRDPPFSGKKRKMKGLGRTTCKFLPCSGFTFYFL